MSIRWILKAVKDYKFWDLIRHKKIISKDAMSNKESMLKVNRDEGNKLVDSHVGKNLFHVELEDTTWPKWEENMVESSQRESYNRKVQ